MYIMHLETEDVKHLFFYFNYTCVHMESVQNIAQRKQEKVQEEEKLALQT